MASFNCKSGIASPGAFLAEIRMWIPVHALIRHSAKKRNEKLVIRPRINSCSDKTKQFLPLLIQPKQAAGSHSHDRQASRCQKHWFLQPTLGIFVTNELPLKCLLVRTIDSHVQRKLRQKTEVVRLNHHANRTDSVCGL